MPTTVKLQPLWSRPTWMSTSLPRPASCLCSTPVDCQDMLDNVQEMTKEYLRSVCQGRQIPLFSVSPKPPHPTTFGKVTVATVKSKLVVILGKLGTFGEHYTCIRWIGQKKVIRRSTWTLWQVDDVIISHVLDIHSAVQIYPVTSSKCYKNWYWQVLI